MAFRLQFVVGAVVVVVFGLGGLGLDDVGGTGTDTGIGIGIHETKRGDGPGDESDDELEDVGWDEEGASVGDVVDEGGSRGLLSRMKSWSSSATSSVVHLETRLGCDCSCGRCGGSRASMAIPGA